MTKMIVWRRPDGGVSITTPCVLPLEKETEPQYLDRIASAFLSAHPDHKSYERLSDATAVDLPKSIRFRDCWRHDGKNIVVDVELARIQVMGEVRIDRNAKLAALDGPYMAAVEQNKPEADGIKVQRQLLRDIPTVVSEDLSRLETVEDLENYVPVWPT